MLTLELEGSTYILFLSLFLFYVCVHLVLSLHGLLHYDRITLCQFEMH
jgi:hypothetical protein